MKNRIAALLLTGTLLTAALAGCGGGKSTPEASASAPAEGQSVSSVESMASVPAAQPEPETESTQEESLAEQPVEIQHLVEFPLEEPFSISISMSTTPSLTGSGLIQDAGQDLGWAKWLHNRTGADIQVDLYSFFDSADKQNLMIASGDYADMIGMFSYPTGMDAAVDDEIVVDLKDMIPEYSPDYYQYLIADDNKLWKSVQTDEGHIGAYVTVGAKPKIADGTMTFQFMLDELGVKKEDLRTVDQYEDYLTAAKNKYGMAAPLYLPGDFMLDGDTLANTYGVALKVDAITGDLPWIVEDGQVKFGYLEDGFTEYVTLLHDWYEKGLIDFENMQNRMINPFSELTAVACAQGDTGYMFSNQPFGGNYSVMAASDYGDPGCNWWPVQDVGETPGQEIPFFEEVTLVDNTLSTSFRTPPALQRQSVWLSPS